MSRRLENTTAIPGDIPPQGRTREKGYREPSYFVVGQLGGETHDSSSDDCSSMGSLGYGVTERNADEEEG